MMKKIGFQQSRIIFGTIAVLAVVLGATYIHFAVRPTDNRRKDVIPTATEIEASASPATTQDVSKITAQVLELYFKTYQFPDVIQVRKALNGYLDGSNYGMTEPRLVIESSTSDDFLYGLSSFSKNYYKSKFIIYTINNNIAGGKNISIIFQDKPDKLFVAWVYKLVDNSYDVRGFGQNLSYTPEKMKQVQTDFKEFLEDRNHAL